MRQQSSELAVRHGRQVHLLWFKGGFVLHPVEAAIASVPMFGVGVVAMLLVVPIDHVNRAVRSGLKIDGDIFWISAKELVFSSVNRFIT